MKNRPLPPGLQALRFIVGLVVLAQALNLALNPAAATTFARTGLPDWFRVALAWGEVAAATLFLGPRTRTVGGISLLFVFGTAAVLHLAHGQLGVGPLLVDAAAVVAILSHRDAAEAGVRPAEAR